MSTHAVRVVAIAAALVVSACHDVTFDPVEDIPHLELPDTGSAIRAILAGIPRPRVYAVGEYHPTREVAQTPFARFSGEIIELLEPRAKHLVVEAWLDATCHQPRAARDVSEQVAAAIGRPSAKPDVSRLADIPTHGLPVTCIEQTALLDAHGRVDFLRLLEMVTEKLHDTTKALLDDGRDVIVYSGALHNDLYPRWPLEDLTFTVPLREEGLSVLEVDLVVPEVVARMESIRSEPWFPLIGLASPEKVIVWERARDSYVVILPAASTDVAKVAKPREPS